jgi:two-component system, LytTR family, response regulator
VNGIRTLIVDDEPLARRGIRQLLAPYPEVIVAAECGNGRDAVRALAAEPLDLVFLDVQIPGLDGLDVIGVRGANRMPLIVFVTAHQEYAVQAFEAQAVDYLVKPLSEARFRATMERVYRRLRARDEGERLELRGADGAVWLDAGEIDWIEAAGDHALIHAGRERYRIRQPLSALEGRLDSRRFARIHRSAIVRLDRVRAVRKEENGEVLLVLRDGTALPLSRRRAAGLRRLLCQIRRSSDEIDRSPHEV